MNPIAAISYPPIQPGITVETQWQAPTTPDGQLFHQALAFHTSHAPETGGQLMQGVAALDAQAYKFHEAMRRLGNDASTDAVMAMQSTQIQTFLVYEGAARAISLTTQGITELMRMQ